MYVTPNGRSTKTIILPNHVAPEQKRQGQKKKPDPSQYLLIGFDTEYQTPEAVDAKAIKEGKAKYEVLSYQFHIRLIDKESDTPKAIETQGIIVPKGGERITLDDFVAFAMGSLTKKYNSIQLPRDIYLIGHFTRADFPAFLGFANEARDFTHAIRNTFVSIDRFKTLTIAYPETTEIDDFSIRMRDTFLLAPANAKSLAEIGEIVGFSKVQLSTDPKEDQKIKENMKAFRKSDWNRFREYAIRDAEICVHYGEKLIRQYDNLFGEFKMPVTLTSFGQGLVLQGWAQKGWNAAALLGQEEVTEKKFNKKLGYPIKKTKMVSSPLVHYQEAFVIESYHGGRNEQFSFGPSPEGDWKDYDLSSAYTTAMSLIGTPNWDTMREVRLDEIEMLDLAFADIEFEFPKSIRFPTMPVRTENGIIFPRKGRTNCGAPELFLAKSLGAKLTLVRAIKVDMDPSKPIFCDFIRQSINERSKHQKGTFDNYFWKEVGNSTYGKTAQGLREKRVYDLRSDDMAPLPPSKLTQPFFASFITSYTRAVLGEMLNSFPEDVTVFSVTTDGFLTTATKQHIEKALKLPLATSFCKARYELVGDDEAIEVKHQVRQPIGWRTRGSATLKRGLTNSGNIVLQKGGIKLPHLLDEDQQNTKTVQLFLNRKPTDVVQYTVGMGLKEMVRGETDFVDKAVTKRLSMEYDWKRKPVTPKEITFRFEGKHYSHVAFDTAPLDDKMEFDAVREAWELYTKKDRECIKTLKDIEDFQTFCLTKEHPNRKAKSYISKKEGDIKRLRRDLTRAFKHGKAGFDLVDGRIGPITNKVFAQTLTDVGIPCKTTDVENAKKFDFVPHTSTGTARVRAALERLTAVYNELKIEEFLVQ